MQQVSLARTVIFRMGRGDVEAVKEQRKRTGVTGNSPGVGDEYPAVVVRNWGAGTVNLQVQLDGPDQYWATSRLEGDEDGNWHWPVIVPAKEVQETSVADPE